MDDMGTTRGRGTARRRRSARGAASVEFALVMLPVLYLIVGGIAFAYMFSFRQALSQSAAEGARAAIGGYNVGDPTCATTGPYPAATCPAQAAAARAVANALVSYDGMACGSAHLVCRIAVGTSATVPGCAPSRTCVSVEVSYPYADHSLLPSLPGFGYVLPDDLTFRSVVQVG